MRLSRLFTIGLAVLALGVAAPAGALQFTPDPTDRLHTIGSGEPGAQWNTGGTGVNGTLVYSQITQEFLMTGVVDLLNYWDASDTNCPTDAGSNCSFDFAPDLEFTLEGALDGIVVTSLGGGFFQVDVNFETTADALPDLQVFDTTDLGFGSVLDANWQAGTFLGNPTTGLVVSAIYDSNNSTVIGDPVGVGFLAIEAGSAYEDLFAPVGIGLDVGSLFDFVPSIDVIVATAISTNTLISFTAEGQGEIFRVDSGEFVPEPGVTVLLATGLIGLYVAGRRRRM